MLPRLSILCFIFALAAAFFGFSYYAGFALDAAKMLSTHPPRSWTTTPEKAEP